MWYRKAKKYNIFGLPISNERSVSLFGEDEEEEDIVEEKPFEEPEIEDPTPEDEFTPEDLQEKVEQITVDPTVGIKLPPLHNNCHCVIETLPILSIPGVRDGRRVWRRSENCCPVCERSSIAFNEAEIQRLRNKGINFD